MADDLMSGLGKLVGNVSKDVEAFQEGGLMGLGKQLVSNLMGGDTDTEEREDGDDADDSDDEGNTYSRRDGKAGDNQLEVNTDHDDDDDIDGNDEFEEDE